MKSETYSLAHDLADFLTKKVVFSLRRRNPDFDLEPHLDTIDETFKKIQREHFGNFIEELKTQDSEEKRDEIFQKFIITLVTGIELALRINK